MSKESVKRKVVYIEWVDSFFLHGWHNNPDVDIAHCVTIGQLLEEDKRKVVVCQSSSDSGDMSDIIAIPKVSIKKKRILKV